MNLDTLIKLIIQPNQASVGDAYWADSKIVMPFSKTANTYGRPFYSDLSINKYHTVLNIGSDSDSTVLFEDNGNEDYPKNHTGIDSMMIIPNWHNHYLRRQELNRGIYNESSILPTYLNVYLGGNESFGFENDFTIELSFYSDDLGLPWCKSHQCLLAYYQVEHLSTLTANTSEALSVAGDFSDGNSKGWGVYLEYDSVYFVANGNLYAINTEVLSANTWYSIAVCRKYDTLYTYLNSNLTNTYNFTKDLNYNYTYGDLDTFEYRLNIGANSNRVNSVGTVKKPINIIDSSFSGGLANLRITTVARYTNTTLPIVKTLPILATSNKIDTHYSNTLFNIPLNYDLFDYSKHYAHFTNKALLTKNLDYAYGFMDINQGQYNDTEYITEPLNNSWTLETYIAPLEGGQPASIDSNFGELFDTSIVTWFENKKVSQIYNSYLTEYYELVTIICDNKFVAQLRWVVHLGLYPCSYLAFMVSTNGTSWEPIASESGVTKSINSSTLTELPDTEIKFFQHTNLFEKGTIQHQDDALFPTNHEPNTHIAIQKNNNALEIYVNGSFKRVVSIPTNLFTGTSYKLRIGHGNGGLLGENTILSLGVKGVRLTNALRYTTNSWNNFPYNHSLQPFTTELNKLVPPRARILTIVRSTYNSIASTQEVIWYVFTSSQLANLSTSDFTLTELEGIEGTSITSINKLTEFQYEVVVDTGINNGILRLNFNDQQTVYYKGTTTPISAYPGELSIEGQTYTINKTAPKPALTSGYSLYVLEPFELEIAFNTAIVEFDTTKIGLKNCTLSNIRLIDANKFVYVCTVTPITYGVVNIILLEAAGITDTGLFTQESDLFVRIFAEYFSILQTPLNIAYQYQDISVTGTEFIEVISNNTEYNNTYAPTGASASLDVFPFQEQSGLYVKNWNATGTPVSSADWTIEWYFRGDTTDSITHLFGLESASTGLVVYSENNEIKFRRDINSAVSIFPEITIDSTYSESALFPHFAITHHNGVYRFYKQGQRVALVATEQAINITYGDLYIGYYPTRIDDSPYLLSNIRFTLGKALYTSDTYNIPSLPYPIPTDIKNEINLLSYVSLTSNNSSTNKAKLNDKIILEFTGIIPLTVESVLINDIEAEYVVENNNYTASVLVDETFEDGLVTFAITTDNVTFTQTTNGSAVVIDNSLPIPELSTLTEYSNYVNILVELNETIVELNADAFEVTNGYVSDIRQLPNTNNYTLSLYALSTGEVTIKLNADKLVDLVGNYNEASNELLYNLVVPIYIPDSYWSNVLLLLEDSYVDKSNYVTTINNTNVVVDTNYAPSGLSQSLYFNGKDASLEFTLNETLPYNIPYTIEFFLRLTSTTLFRLGTPVALPGSNMSYTKFTANWQPIPEASNYVIDVAKDSNFLTPLPGYQNKNVGDVQTVDIGSTSNETLVDVPDNVYVDTHGFLANWRPIESTYGYRYQVSRDSNFTDIVETDNNKFVVNNYSSVGKLEKLKQQFYNKTEVENNLATASNPTSGVLLKGLFANSDYPKLLYVAQESTIRVYKDDTYTIPIVSDYIDPHTFLHIALANDGRYLKLYVDGVLQDKIRSIGFNTNVDVGYALGYFYGHIAGLRVTKNINRYPTDFIPPTLPYGKS